MKVRISSAYHLEVRKNVFISKHIAVRRAITLSK
nr:MAG TPA: hypothetical protein [Caudoviricetes sp.]